MFDYFIFLLPAFLLSLWASFKVKSNFKKYSNVRAMCGMTGAQVAQEMLGRAGIQDVTIRRSKGMLSDHYNPTNKTLALSDQVYGSTSIAAISVAAHEAGHALQHAKNYGPLGLRSALVPTAGIGSQIGFYVMLIGAFMQLNGIILIGAGLFSLVLLFQLVTLPVEFDASNRAKALLFQHGFISDGEKRGVSKVLNAAAWTYVAAAVSTLMTLAYFLMRARD